MLFLVPSGEQKQSGSWHWDRSQVGARFGSWGYTQSKELIRGTPELVQRSSHRRKSKSEEGVISSFKWFLPVFATRRGGGRGSALCGVIVLEKRKNSISVILWKMPYWALINKNLNLEKNDERENKIGRRLLFHVLLYWTVVHIFYCRCLLKKIFLRHCLYVSRIPHPHPNPLEFRNVCDRNYLDAVPGWIRTADTTSHFQLPLPRNINLDPIQARLGSARSGTLYFINL